MIRGRVADYLIGSICLLGGTFMAYWAVITWKW